MASKVLPAKESRSVGRSLVLTIPTAVWAALMFTAYAHANRSQWIASLITVVFEVVLFFMMVRTRSTYRWRRWFFVALGLLFPVGFIHEVIVMRGTMGIPIEEMIAGRTPFCFIPIPLLILPAALTKMLVFPGSILPNGGMSGGGMAAMAGIWLAVTIVVGKAGVAMHASSAGSRREWHRCPRAHGYARSTPAGATAPGLFFWPWYCCRWRYSNPHTACGSALSRRSPSTWRLVTRWGWRKTESSSYYLPAW